jgi:DNA-binding SARP family transcriptional activator
MENVATLVSRVRAALGPDVVVGGRDGYRLGVAVRIDLHDAAQLVTAAERHVNTGRRECARAFADRALKLLDSGSVLTDHQGAPWTQVAHVQHIELLRRARHTASQAALAMRDAHAAAAAAQAAIQADPLDEVAYRALLTAYNLAGEPARALTAYERLRRTLAHELGVDPAQATRDVHASILQAGQE